MQKFMFVLTRVVAVAVVAGSVGAHAQYGPLVQPIGNQPPQNNSYNLSPGTVNQPGTGTKHSVPGSTNPGTTTQGSTNRGQTGTNGWNRVRNVGSGNATQGNTGQTQTGTSGWNRTRNVGSGTTTQTQTGTGGWDVKQSQALTPQSNTQGLGQSQRNPALVQQGSSTRGQTVGGTTRPQSNLISGAGGTRPQTTSIPSQQNRPTAAPPHRNH